MHKKIDIHTHAKLYKRKDYPRSLNMTPEEFKAAFEKLGIYKAVNLPTLTPVSIENPENVSHLQLNEEAHYIAQKYPDMFYWFCNINARMIGNNYDIDFTEYLEYYKGLGAKGVGEITANVYFDEPYIESLFSSCEKLNMPVIFHVGPRIGGCYGLVDDPGLPRLEKELAKFPGLKFLGHSQPFWAEISSNLTSEQRNGYPTGKVTPGRVIELMRKYPNLCGDLSAGSAFNAMTRDIEFGYSFIEEFQDRLYYGTDINDPYHVTLDFVKLSYWLDEAFEKGKISRLAYEKVCYGNALDLLEK